MLSGAASLSELYASAQAAWSADARLQFAYPDLQTFFEHCVIAYRGIDLGSGDSLLETGSRLLDWDQRLAAEAFGRMQIARRPLSAEARPHRVADRLGDRLTLWVYGPLSDSHVSAALVCDALELHDDALAVFVRLDCSGGDLAIAIAIQRALSRHRARKLVVVDRACWSGAGYLLAAADRILVRRDATLMFHRSVCSIRGDWREISNRAIDLQTADHAYQRSLAHRRAGNVSLQRIKELWDGRFICAEDAVSLGLADSVIAPLKIHEQPQLKES
jgi:ATP-dependent protease ClpP protease subunit